MQDDTELHTTYSADYVRDGIRQRIVPGHHKTYSVVRTADHKTQQGQTTSQTDHVAATLDNHTTGYDAASDVMKRQPRDYVMDYVDDVTAADANVTLNGPNDDGRSDVMSACDDLADVTVNQQQTDSEVLHSFTPCK